MTPGLRVPLLAWDRPLYCNIPALGEVDLDMLGEADGGGDRWNEPGEPTAYFGVDRGVALAELARHHEPVDEPEERRIIRIEPSPGRFAGLVDLRDPAVLGALGASPDPTAFLDRAVTRALARQARALPETAGLVVPSMAFLDRTERCTVVVFSDRLEGGIPGSIATWREVGRITCT